MKFRFIRAYSWTCFSAVLLLSLIWLTACGHTPPSAAADKIRVGFMAGPYIDLFKRGIAPILEKQGYTVEAVEFANSNEPNKALLDGSIDANVFQHAAYLASYNEQQHVDLSVLTITPTAPLALYSGRHKSLSELQEGARIALPNDPANLARSLCLLAKAGILSLDPRIHPLAVTEKDIISNAKHIVLAPLPAPQLPHLLNDTDYSIIPGSHALAAGIGWSEALLLEQPPDAYHLIAAIKASDAGKPFAKALAAAYHSEAFLHFLEEDEVGKGFFTAKRE